MALIAGNFSELEYRRTEVARMYATIQGLVDLGYPIDVARAKGVENMHLLSPGEIIEMHLDGKIDREETIRGILVNSAIDDTPDNRIFCRWLIIGQAVRWGE